MFATIYITYRDRKQAQKVLLHLLKKGAGQ